MCNNFFWPSSYRDLLADQVFQDQKVNQDHQDLPKLYQEHQVMSCEMIFIYSKLSKV